ncbi:MAG: hypothetical protein CMJ81_13400 [Planctomycetaceae bacterium]|nr:hypothetical protein [Planctomycetaceae bacterium]MBP60543.1 hypothetical protein [Planctomycetaceae bacterium]
METSAARPRVAGAMTTKPRRLRANVPLIGEDLPETFSGGDYLRTHFLQAFLAPWWLMSGSEGEKILQ